MSNDRVWNAAMVDLATIPLYKKIRSTIRHAQIQNLEPVRIELGLIQGVETHLALQKIAERGGQRETAEILPGIEVELEGLWPDWVHQKPTRLWGMPVEWHWAKEREVLIVRRDDLLDALPIANYEGLEAAKLYAQYARAPINDPHLRGRMPW